MNKKEIIVLLFLIVIGVGYYFFSHSSQSFLDKDKAFVYHENKLIKVIPLKKTGLYPFTGEAGGLTVEVLNENIRVKSSRCPAQICVNTGFVSRPGDIIICAPNRITIQIGRQSKNLDATSQ